MMIFERKYAPQNFGDLIFPDSNTRQRVWEFGNNKRHNSLIFHGPYGTAKTTTARMLNDMRTDGLQAGEADFYRASDITGGTLDRISNVQVMQRLAGVTMPVTIVDEIDQVDEKLQYQLRWQLDMRSEQGCFVFTTNKLHRVDPGLVDRCDVIELPAANTDHWFERAKHILQQEGVKMSEAKLRALLSTCDGSIRDLMRSLEDAVLRSPKIAAAGGAA
mgnify:CR=1 FL=1